MTLLVILTYVAFGLIIVALALALIAILLRLRKIQYTLGTVNVGVRSIARRVEPLEPVLGGINGALAGVRDALVAVLLKKRAPKKSEELV